MKNYRLLVFVGIAIIISTPASTTAQEVTPVTTIHKLKGNWNSPAKNYVILQRGDVEIVVVNNQAVDDEILPGHRGGYSGIARISHSKQSQNLFVSNYAGINYEHIHDGRTRERKILFEPRNLPMEIRHINQHTVELYQAPAGHYKLESCQRYELLKDGTIQLTYECTPRARTFENGYIGLFWASYIDQPEDKSIHFSGFENVEGKSLRDLPPPQMVRGVTPQHGIQATHRGRLDTRMFKHDADFPLTLVFGYSRHRFDQPWYYGVSRNMGFAQIFRSADQIRLTQSPSGGGGGNPAWDFQYFIPDYEVGKTYRFMMRAVYHPFDQQDVFFARITKEYRRLNNSK
ncbi:MAG: hypothetical protein CMJ76_14085 [Planctomycetaceae bacterium]|nr:hypothetical protein [Planctomycetaceae bacterium]|tara:strand:- start:3823 stop:4857 length:1035 start_codon:yes stop_codon:yes gene_type:complete